MPPKGMQKNAAVLATPGPRLSRRYNGVIKLRIFKGLRRPWRWFSRRRQALPGRHRVHPETPPLTRARRT
jgi:hypothetical protein